MRGRSYEQLLRRSLKQRSLHHSHPLYLAICPPSGRPFSSTPKRDEPREVAILGGGITGLASAYYLTRADPSARITLYEATERVGGWMQSTHVEVEGGRILFERGPRTLRPSGNGLVTAKLLDDLELRDDIVYVPKTAPAARNRFIYYPDRLRRLPAPGMGLLAGLSNLWANRDLFQGLFSGVFKDLSTEYERGSRSSDHDESIGAFLSRRFDRHIADNLASAVFHGIYAGDVYRLSVRSLTPFLPYLEERYGSCASGFTSISASGRKIMERRLWDISQEKEMTKMDVGVYKNMRRCSVFTLRGGLSQFTNRLEEVLKENDNVTFKRSAPVARVYKSGEGGPAVRPMTVDCGPNGQIATYDTVVSALGHNTLASLIRTEGGSPAYQQPNVSVMLVNLFFPNPKLLEHNAGFGYLIPRSVSYQNNPEFALGVVFDSYAAPGQDTARGTKVTVMLGGHWWDSFQSLPGEQEGLWMARSVLARHLGITDEPAAHQVSLQRDCIPQYVVGHRRQMGGFHSQLLRDFGGRLRVAGASYGGVGVNDCIRGAYDLGKEVQDKGWTGAVTGLERYSSEKLDIVELAQEGGEFRIVEPGGSRS